MDMELELHLASMEKITCWAFRKLFPVTDSYTGVLSLSYLLKKKEWKEIDLFPIPGQRQWIQIATSKETECQKFIERLIEEQKNNPEQYNVYGIQLNCSCPSPYLTNIGQGPALIKRTSKVISLLKTLLNQNKFKVSLKTRLGFAGADIRQGKIFHLLSEIEKMNDKNFSYVVVHFKHAREQSYTPYNYSLLKKISAFNVPLIINGGICSRDDFLKITENVDKKNIIGYMMGREALRNPNCFNTPNNLSRTSGEIKKQFENNCKLHPPKEVYVKTIMNHCPWAKDLKINF